MKIVINNCYGGFGLSLKAKKRFAELQGMSAFFYKQIKYAFRDGKNEYIKINDLNDDSLFIHAVLKDVGNTVTDLDFEGVKWFSEYTIDRNNPNLIKVIKELGQEANGRCANLKIVDIPDDVEWEISEYDGLESIEEKHRSWN